MLFVIPVTLFSVTYETGSGRPYSGFERLVLKAIAGGRTDLAALEREFRVHRRVVIESLVTLIHAGWVALGSAEADLVLTPAGNAAASSEADPTTLVVERPPPATVVMEQVTGAVVHSSKVRYTTRWKLADVWKRAIRLPAQIHDISLDLGRVQQLLPCKAEQWIRWIDPDIGLRSSGAHYVVADLETETGRIEGLPRTFADAVEPQLRLHAGGRLRMALPLDLVADSNDAVRPTRWSTRVSPADVVVGTEEHGARVEGALATASSRVLIASAFVTRAAVEALAPQMETAARRGVDIDLLWGYSSESAPTSGLAAVEALALALQGSGSRGRIRFNRAPSGSHMKVLIWDEPSGWRTVIGSHNWLSAYRSIPLVDASLELDCVEVVGTIARHVASIWAATSGEALSAVPSSWQAVAAELSGIRAAEREVSEPLPADSEDRVVDVSLVYGRSHEVELRNALRSSRHRLVIGTHTVSAAGVERLAWGVEAEREPNFRGVILVGEVLADSGIEAVEEAASRASCRLLKRPLHAKVLVSDSSAVIGSYNYLAADPTGFGSRARELSVKVHDGDVAGFVLRRLVEGRSPSQ